MEGFHGIFLYFCVNIAEKFDSLGEGNELADGPGNKAVKMTTV